MLGLSGEVRRPGAKRREGKREHKKMQIRVKRGGWDQGGGIRLTLKRGKAGNNLEKKKKRGKPRALLEVGCKARKVEKKVHHQRKKETDEAGANFNLILKKKIVSYEAL